MIVEAHAGQETKESVEKSGQRQKLVLGRECASALLMISQDFERRKIILCGTLTGS
jgi:hypothetical protein